MIKEIKIGEIVKIKHREFLLTEIAIGGTDKLRPTLILIDNLFKKTNRYPYFKRKNLTKEKVLTSRIKGLRKLTNFKVDKIIGGKK